MIPFLRNLVRAMRRNRRLAFFLASGAVATVVAILGNIRTFEYMDTPEFCGQPCHAVMKPQYAAYQASPHARVACVNCHIGPGAFWMVRAKLSGVRQVFALLFNTYERPIPSPVRELRPARETCEQCHWPQKLSEDRIRVYRSFAQDERNSPQVRALAFKVGGGTIDGATGIHWHIANKVWYLPVDEKRQEIGWVGTEDAQGQLTEYLPKERPQARSPERIQTQKRLMDCIDCHNRATHIFHSPERMVDNAIAQGKLAADLPFIKKLAMEAFQAPNPEPASAQEKLQAIEAFYKGSYPQLDEEGWDKVTKAIAELERLLETSSFPDMRVNWSVYPDNLGHSKSPGCFRCHGQLATTVGGQEKVIDANCNLCHYPVSLPADRLELPRP